MDAYKNTPRAFTVALSLTNRLNLRDSYIVKIKASSKRLLCINLHSHSFHLYGLSAQEYGAKLLKMRRNPFLFFLFFM